jgi:putative glutamine amidotransferase
MALERGMPMLCICRGLQALNVARGGTLVQHLSGHRQTESGRRRPGPRAPGAGSRLADALGATDVRVNSFHHQAVDRLGLNLEVVARADDGLVEGIEATDRDWVVGVQWHAEGLVDATEQHALFEAFLDAAMPRRPGRQVA